MLNTAGAALTTIPSIRLDGSERADMSAIAREGSAYRSVRGIPLDRASNLFIPGSLRSLLQLESSTCCSRLIDDIHRKDIQDYDVRLECVKALAKAKTSLALLRESSVVLFPLLPLDPCKRSHPLSSSSPRHASTIASLGARILFS